MVMIHCDPDNCLAVDNLLPVPVPTPTYGTKTKWVALPRKLERLAAITLLPQRKRRMMEERRVKSWQGKRRKLATPLSAPRKASARKNNYRDDLIHAVELILTVLYP
jgi:hypothetical protein